MSRKFTEIMKSAVIVALMINAVFLAYKSEVFGEFLGDGALSSRLAEYFGRSDGGETVSGGEGKIAEQEIVIRPKSVAIVNQVGTRCGASCNDTLLESMYEATANIFGEALGSVTVAELCTEEEWRAALALPGVFWDYQSELPINSLVKWLGMSMLNDNADYASRFAAVIGEEGRVYVYYASSSGFYRCGSAATAESVENAVAEFLPNGAYFAFESEKVRDMVAPYTMLLPETDNKYILEAVNLLEEPDIRGKIAEQLGMNILGDASYAEKNGTMVYVGVSGILRIQTDGKLNYSITDDDYSTSASEENATDEQLIERACTVVSAIKTGCAGAEKLYFSGIRKTDSGRITVSFEYYADGMKIVQRNGAAAEIVYENGHMVSLDIWMLQYQFSEETTSLLPALQAAAIAAGQGEKGELELVYYNDAGRLKPVWVTK